MGIFRMDRREASVLFSTYLWGKSREEFSLFTLDNLFSVGYDSGAVKRARARKER